MKNTWQNVSKILKGGGVAIIPTDTIYGIVGSALSRKTVERIYKLKGRDENKPFIVLISSYKDLEKFGVSNFNTKFWPGKVSVILAIENKVAQNKFKYLHRGTNTIAFRMVGKRNRNLFTLLESTGPLVAPSVNPQGLEPALSISESKKYFGDRVDAYLYGGTKNGKPSTLVLYKDGELVILRQGAVSVK